MKVKTTPFPNAIEVDLESETHTVRFESPINAVKVDGQKLNDIHDLAVKVDTSSLYISKLTRRINVLAYIATFLAVMCVVLLIGVGGWLFANKDRIDESLTSSKTEMLKLQNTNGALMQKLLSLGWKWKDGKWTYAVTNLSPKPQDYDK